MSIVYRDLDRQRQEIRLLELLPSAGPKYARIPECRLIQSSLLEKPQYAALSYCWGDPERNRVIIVDDLGIRIPQNLFEALIELRPTEGSLIIWIDYLCINQNNNSEKSWQVGLMKEIYSRADGVLAWLGPGNAESDLVLEYLDKIGRKAETCGFHFDPHIANMAWRVLLAAHISSPLELSRTAFRAMLLTRFMQVFPEPAPEDWFHLFSGLYHETAFKDIFRMISGSDPRGTPSQILRLEALDALERLFTRAWWGRVWVLQEIAVSERAEFICGSVRISRHHLCAAINAYSAFRSILAEEAIVPNIKLDVLTAYQRQIFIRFFHCRPTIMANAWRLYGIGHFPLFALLRITCVGSVNLKRHGPHNLESTVPCDKIFALLGLASDREELKKKGVYPDYSKSHQEVSITNPLQIPNDNHMTMEPKFYASGKTTQTPSVVVNGRSLSLDGYVYDKIYKVGEFPRRLSSNEVPILETFSWPGEWLIEILRLTYQRNHHFSTFEERLRAAARSSTGGTAYLRTAQLSRAGDSRFEEAAFLLRNGINNIKNKYIKSEAERFLANEGLKQRLQNMNMLHLHLSNEIIGRSPKRLPFITSKGHVCLGADNTQEGDCVAIIKGAEVPYILRLQQTGSYQLIGEAYVDGIMDGEASENLNYTRITLI
ncbi:hypothetical protein MGN70_006984 [Eutypa lata]|nr:hypothetical protein MGN70_006984 [Eutypa lata]